MECTLSRDQSSGDRMWHRQASELALMSRGILALIRKGSDIQPLADKDHTLNLAADANLRNASSDRQEQSRRDTAENVIARLNILRRNILWSFATLASAVIASALLRHFIPAPTKQYQALLGVASIFLFAWATFGRLGWPGQSHGGNSVIERLDDHIFKLLYWIAMFVGVLALI